MQRDTAALKAALADLEQRNLTRRRRSGVDAGLVNFCSNDYLGLKDHAEVVSAFVAAANRYGVGSGASHLVTGHGPEHEALEQELADFTGREKALVFSTGYMANLGVIGTIADQSATIISDKLNHASLIDACRLSGAEVKRFRHGDSAHAAELLVASESPTRLVVTDGVFSMDGDLAPLPELAQATRARQAWLIVDDAHGLGVIGKNGRGSCEHFGLSADDVPALVGTFGKAFGTFGAFVAVAPTSSNCCSRKRAPTSTPRRCRRPSPPPRARRCGSASENRGDVKRRWPCRDDCGADWSRWVRRPASYPDIPRLTPPSFR